MNPLSLQQKIPLIGVVGHPRFVIDNPYAVRVFPSALDEASALSYYMKSKKEDRIAIISLEDEYFLSLSDQFKKLQEKKEHIVFSETVSPNEQDFATLLQKIKATQPTALLINLGPSQTVQIVRKVRESKLMTNLYANFVMGMGDVRSALGSQGEGIVFAELDFEKPMFLKEMHGKFGESQASPIGYSCYLALTYAHELVRVAKERKISVSAAFEFISEIPTLDGNITFVNREVQLKVVPKIIRSGQTAKLS